MNRVLLVARQAACVGFLAWAKRTFTRQDSCSVPSYKTNHVIVLDIAYPPSRSTSAGAKSEEAGGGGSAGWPTVRAIRHVVSWGKNARGGRLASELDGRRERGVDEPAVRRKRRAIIARAVGIRRPAR